MKVAIFTDSGTNIYQEQLENQQDIFVSSLQIIDETTGYRDGIEMTSLQTYDLLEKGVHLKTSSPLVQDMIEQFEKIKAQGYDFVFGINITSGLSSTRATVAMLAQEVGIEFDSIDCFTTARVQYECVVKARDLFHQGKSVSEVKAILTEMIHYSTTFVVPVDMKHLVKGGRLTPLAAKLAGLLKIVPILYLNQETNGKIESFKKVRTLKKAFSVMIDTFVEMGIDSSYKICVAHVKAKEQAKEFLNMILERIPSADVYITDLVSVVGVHTGLGCVACQFVKK